MGDNRKCYPTRLLLISLLCTLFVFAQDNDKYRFEYIDISMGLSNNYVSKIVTDGFGKKWFATEGGLNSYDGENFGLYRPNTKYSELKNENIETLFHDSKGRIWVGTKSGGVSSYDPRTDTFANYNDQIDRNGRLVLIRVTGILEDDEGDIWITTWDNGIFVLSSDKLELKESYAQGQRISDITKDPFGNIWMISPGLLYKYSKNELRLDEISLDLRGTMSLYFDSGRNRLLIGGGKGLFQLNTNNYDLEELKASIDSNLKGINSINIDNKGKIWAGSWTQGLFVSTSDQSQFEKLSLRPEHLSNSNYEVVLDIQIDDNDIIWVATGYGGVVKISPKTDIQYFANSLENNIGLPDNNIQSIYKDSSNNLWCGTWGGGIGYSRNGQDFEQLPGTKDIKISSFQQVGETMFVGSSKGVYRYDIKNPKGGFLSRSLDKYKIKVLFLDLAGMLWVGTQQNGLVTFNYKEDPLLQNGTWYRPNEAINDGLNSERISTLNQDQDGTLWVGTYNGLYRFDPSNSTFAREDNFENNKFPSVIILSMFTRDKDTLWVGVPGGLLKVLNKDNRLQILKKYGSEHGLKNDYITGVTTDSDNNIWLSNVGGIATLIRDEDVIINLTSDVDQHYSMNIGSYYNDGEKLYFGSSDGFFAFNPLHSGLSKAPPELVFTSLKVDNKEVLVGQEINNRILLTKNIGFTKEIQLSYKESIVSLSCTVTDYLDKTNLNYYYRVRGLRDEWINNGDSGEINFIGLNSGDYILEVKSTRDKINFGEVQKMKLNITPPFWKSKTAYALYFLLLAGLAILINKISINRTRLKANLEMAKMSKIKERELNEVKLKFFTNISHELRTPLTLIISPVSEMLSQSNLKLETREKLNYVEKNAKRLLELINQLLEFRKADRGLLKLQVVSGNFVSFAQEIFLSFKGYAESENINYNFKSSTESIPLTFDGEKMEIVLCNLISNAFKFASTNGKVTLSISADDTYCNIGVSDNGRGISQENHKKVFNRFFQIQNTDTAKIRGSGIGLSLSQKIVDLHRGNISINSNVPKGTEFLIQLPLGNHHFKSNDFAQDSASSEDVDNYSTNVIEPTFQLEKTNHSKNKALETLLIIDDNTDIRSYIASFFENDFTVLTAENGLAGKEIAEEFLPDLIISDVMMPEINGLELCKILKSQISTSHIPIILLTARTSTVYEVDGLKIGADDYVKKPFNIKALRSRVISQLENRKRVHEYLRNKIRFETDSNIQAVDFEERFIDKVFSIVEDHIDDTEFGIEPLADKLHMSQSTLYRKIKSLTDLSISGFIRSVRLKKASEILLKEDMKLSAVAYTVGFNDYKYFKKSFINQYQISPRDFRAENRKNKLI